MKKYLSCCLTAAASILLCSSICFASDDFNQGTLNVNGGAQLVLKGKKGGEISLQSGQADITVSSAGFFGDGYLKVSTNGGEITIDIPRKSYSNGENFMSYAKDSGQQYNIRGTFMTDVKKAAPFNQNQDCTFQATTFDVPVDVSNLVAPCPCSTQDANGATVQTHPGQPAKTVSIRICESGAKKAGDKSEIKYSENGLCPGSNVEQLQEVITTNHYKLEFFDAKQSSAPVVAVFEGAQPPQSTDQDLGAVSPCQ